MNFGNDGGSLNKSRAWGIGFVVGFHILLVWGLVNGLARKAVELLPSPIETKIIEEVEAPIEEPPPPKPEFEPPPPPYIPPPDIVIAAPPKATTAITQTTQVKPKPKPRPKPRPKPKVKRVPPSIDFKRSPRACKQPRYPSASERLGEEGTSAISLLVGTDGKVQQSKVLQTSGHERLDNAAIKAFSRCKFRVGTVNGKPEPSWFSIRYKWVVPR